MSFLKNLERAIFGGSVSGGEIDWSELQKVMDYSAQLNRYNDTGLFTGSEWDEGPDGTWSRRQTVNPALQPGLDRIMARATGQGWGDPYQMPSQFSQLLDAKMANQFDRHGLGGGATPDPSTYGMPSAQQPGRTPMPSSPPPAPVPQTQAGQGGGAPSGISQMAAQMGAQMGPLAALAQGGGGGRQGGVSQWDILRKMAKV
jgi:hypothetical protein